MKRLASEADLRWFESIRAHHAYNAPMGDDKLGEKLHGFPTGGGIFLYGDNEVKFVTGIGDPVKIGIVVPDNLIGPGSLNLGGVSFGTLRTDGSDKADELIFIKGVVDGISGAVAISLYDPASGGVKEVVNINRERAFFAMPIHAPNMGGGNARFRSDDGRYVYNVQGDATPDFPHGRIVQYDTHGSADETTWTAVAIIRPEKL